MAPGCRFVVIPILPGVFCFAVYPQKSLQPLHCRDNSATSFLPLSLIIQEKAIAPSETPVCGDRPPLWL
ncbi:MAG: hypothetical protein HC851_24180 [Acaryochloris sp. RU_4_1]|nr:hypothetical protein [Acaryochloris sp. RU_4_1]